MSLKSSSHTYCNSTTDILLLSICPLWCTYSPKTPNKSLKSRRVKGESFSQRNRAVPPRVFFLTYAFRTELFGVKKLKRSSCFSSLVFSSRLWAVWGDLLGEFVVFYICHTLFKKGTHVFFQKNNSISPPRFVL